jgi:MSHA pilin protein MshD
MPTECPATKNIFVTQAGVSLVELIVFIVVLSIALVALLGAFLQATTKNAEPLIRVRMLEAAQSQLDEIMALKYDANTPSGGVPACNSPGAASCNNTPDADMNDVDDYQAWSDTPYAGYSRKVAITIGGSTKLIQVTVTSPSGESITLAAERTNF